MPNAPANYEIHTAAMIEERGFAMDLERRRLSELPGNFFGTEEPFYASYYRVLDPDLITAEQAIGALNTAIAALPQALN